MRNLTSSFLVCMAIIICSCQPSQPTQQWFIALKTDQSGETIAGSKQNLIKALRSGADLKVGWGWKYEEKTLEHIAYPTWIGILNEREVYAYLDPQVLSGISWENLTAHYEDSTLLTQEWRVVINTDGSFDAVWTDRTNSEIIKRKPQNHIMTWWVNQSINEKSVPYFSVSK